MTYVKIAAIAFLAMGLASCTDPDGAKKAAESSGVTGFKATGYSWLGCGQDDVFSTGFTGVGANGKPVSGVVCSGWFKGSTVRFY